MLNRRRNVTGAWILNVITSDPEAGPRIPDLGPGKSIGRSQNGDQPLGLQLRCMFFQLPV